MSNITFCKYERNKTVTHSYIHVKLFARISLKNVLWNHQHMFVIRDFFLMVNAYLVNMNIFACFSSFPWNNEPSVQNQLKQQKYTCQVAYAAHILWAAVHFMQGLYLLNPLHSCIFRNKHHVFFSLNTEDKL